MKLTRTQRRIVAYPWLIIVKCIALPVDSILWIGMIFSCIAELLTSLHHVIARLVYWLVMARPIIEWVDGNETTDDL